MMSNFDVSMFNTPIFDKFPELKNIGVWLFSAKNLNLVDVRP